MWKRALPSIRTPGVTHRRRLHALDLLEFPNLSFFGKYCRTHFGVSPTECRKQLREISKPFASVRLKGTSFKCTANELGRYQLRAPEGRYILQVSAIGYATHEQQVTLTHERKTLDVRLFPLQKQLDEAVVVAHSVERVNGSAYNAVAIGTTSPSLTWRRKPHPPEP